MNFHILTLFPEMINQVMGTSIMGRACEQGTISCEAVNIRDFSNDKHRRVDDYTYGGGAGMLMQAQPIFDAYCSIENKIPKDNKRQFLYVTPQGRPFDQKMAQEFASCDDLIILCGHYEGVDERVLTELNARPVSVGDYVLTGGELPALIIMDAVARLVPDVLHNEESAEIESFHRDLLEYPQYTRPEEWHGQKIPEVLLSGNPRDIDQWRKEKSIERTKERRPDLYEKYSRMEKIRTLLMKNKRDLADMIHLIDSGNAQIVTKIADAVLLRDQTTGTYYFANLSRDVVLTKDVFTKLYEMTGGKIAESISKIVLHDPSDVEEIMEILDLEQAEEKILAVYTLKEKISVSRVEKMIQGSDVPAEVGDFLTMKVNTALDQGYIPYNEFPVSFREFLTQFEKMGCFTSKEKYMVLF